MSYCRQQRKVLRILPLRQRHAQLDNQFLEPEQRHDRCMQQRQEQRLGRQGGDVSIGQRIGTDRGRNRRLERQHRTGGRGDVRMIQIRIPQATDEEPLVPSVGDRERDTPQSEYQSLRINRIAGCNGQRLAELHQSFVDTTDIIKSETERMVCVGRKWRDRNRALEIRYGRLHVALSVVDLTKTHERLDLLWM